MTKIYRFFIPAIIILFVLSHSVSVYSDDDNSGGGNDGGSVTGGDVGAESISGSATDEQGNTTTFDSQGNITGESGPGGGPVSDGTTQGPSATGQTDGPDGAAPVSASATGTSPISAPGSAMAQAEASLIAAVAAQEQFGGLGATLFDQIEAQAAVSQALAAWDAAISQYGADMQTSYPSSFSWDIATSLADFGQAINAIAEINSRTEVAGQPAPAPAPAAAPVLTTPIAPVAPIAPTSSRSGVPNYSAAPQIVEGDGVNSRTFATPLSPTVSVGYNISVWTNTTNQTIVSVTVQQAGIPGERVVNNQVFNNAVISSEQLASPTGVGEFLTERGVTVPGLTK